MNQRCTKVAVLVVEDEPIILWDIADELRSAGYLVFEATNADDAIAILEDNKEIEVLFTDINMPGSMDGMKLAHAARTRWPPIKIILTSGVARFKDFQLPVGGVFVAKPYEPSAVIGAMASLLK